MDQQPTKYIKNFSISTISRTLQHSACYKKPNLSDLFIEFVKQTAQPKTAKDEFRVEGRGNCLAENTAAVKKAITSTSNPLNDYIIEA